MAPLEDSIQEETSSFTPQIENVCYGIELPNIHQYD